MKNSLSWITAAALIRGVVAIAAGTRDEGRMPDLDGAVAWVNSAPPSSNALRGKAVLVHITAEGPEAAPSNDVRPPETYVGYPRMENFASPDRMARDSRRIYSPPARLSRANGDSADRGTSAPGKIVFRFHSRGVHMVLGASRNGAPVLFKIKLNGVAP